jgi:hypothetical protein
MTEQNKPNDADQVNVTNANDEAAARVSRFQLPPKIDTNQAGASEAYGEGSIQILEGLEAVRASARACTSVTRPTARVCTIWCSSRGQLD